MNRVLSALQAELLELKLALNSFLILARVVIAPIADGALETDQIF
jgi:hypothetical protein